MARKTKAWVHPKPPADPVVLDLFAGPGGWDTGIISPHFRTIGIEYDINPVMTAVAAGHVRIQADVSAVNPCSYGPIWGLILSPPCQGFTPAGKKVGKFHDTSVILESISKVRTLEDIVALIAELNGVLKDPRSILVLEPLRYALALKPVWIALEQVSNVQPIWDAMVEPLEANGYIVETATVSSEMFGVPQARKRAILVAKLATHVEPGTTLMPVQTHSRLYPQQLDKRDEGVADFVTLAQAMESMTGTEYVPDMANGDSPDNAQWAFNRPSVTIVGTFRPDILAGPGWRDVGSRGRQYSQGSVKITLEQAGMLQSFPVDYPWQGAKTRQWQQVGDAVPPRMAHAIVNALVGDDMLPPWSYPTAYTMDDLIF